MQTIARVISLEAAIISLGEPVARIDSSRAHKSRGSITLCLEQLRQVRKGRGQGASDLAHAYRLRICARKNVGMRHDAGRRLRVGMFEDQAVGCEMIEVRGECQLRAEKPHSVRAGRVERDQDDARLRGRSGSAET